MNLWNGPSLGLVWFSTALCCAEELLLIYYYYYYPWNESNSSNPMSIKPKVTFLWSSGGSVASSVFQGSGSQLIVRLFPKLPGAVAMRNRRLFPAERGERSCQLGPLFLLPSQPQPAPGNASAGPPERAGDSGTTCRNPSESQCISQNLLNPQEMSFWWERTWQFPCRSRC